MGALVRLVLLIVALAPATAVAADGLRFTGESPARVPIQVLGRHVVARGTVNGSDSIAIVIDTGAAATVVDDAFAQRIGLEVDGQAVALGAGGPERGHRYAAMTVALAGLELDREGVVGLQLANLGKRAGHGMEVVLGYELFADAVVVIDYAASVMEVWDPARGRPPERGIALPLEVRGRHPYVTGTVTLADGSTRSGRFVIDTGSSAGLMLTTSGPSRDSLVATFPRTLETLGRGVGGEVRHTLGRARAFELGTLRFEAPIAVVPRIERGFLSEQGALGNLGGMLLERTRVTLDYARSVVRFEPNARLGAPFEADMSGMVFTPDGDDVVVRIVREGSPAARAGVRVGDVVTHLDGAPVAGRSIVALRDRLQRDGDTVPVVLRRGGRRREATLVLARVL